MLGIDVHYKGAHPLKRAVWNSQVIKPTLEVAGVYWHSKLRAKHFTAEGAQEYGYTKRKGELIPRGSKRFRRSYTGRKLAMKGHTRPLVFSGEGEALSRIQDVRATAKRVRVILPRKFNFRHPKSQVDMRAELTAISQADEKQLGTVADKEVHARLNAVKTVEIKHLA